MEILLGALGIIATVGLGYWAIKASRSDGTRGRRRQLADEIANLMRPMVRAARDDTVNTPELRQSWESLRLRASSEDHGDDVFELVWCIVEAERAYDGGDLSLPLDRGYVTEGLDRVALRVLNAWVDDPKKFDERVAAERTAFWEFGQDRRTTVDKYRRIEIDEKLGLSWRMLAGVTRRERRRALVAAGRPGWWSRLTSRWRRRR